MRALARRIGRIEAAKVADVIVPNVLFVGMNETLADARARFAAAFPHRSPNHAVLTLPAKPRTDAERALWAERFRARQLALVAAARSERIAIVKADQSAPRSAPKIWPTSPTIRPNGPHVTWKPNA